MIGCTALVLAAVCAGFSARPEGYGKKTLKRSRWAVLGLTVTGLAFLTIGV